MHVIMHSHLLMLVAHRIRLKKVNMMSGKPNYRLPLNWLTMDISVELCKPSAAQALLHLLVKTSISSVRNMPREAAIYRGALTTLLELSSTKINSRRSSIRAAMVEKELHRVGLRSSCEPCGTKEPVAPAWYISYKPFAMTILTHIAGSL
jgi:hypothetical protein